MIAQLQAPEVLHPGKRANFNHIGNSRNIQY